MHNIGTRDMINIHMLISIRAIAITVVIVVMWILWEHDYYVYEIVALKTSH